VKSFYIMRRLNLNTILRHTAVTKKMITIISKQKGYNDTEVAEIWNNDIRHDVISNLLWLRANAPNAAEKVLADFVNLKNNNPYQSNPNPNE